MLQELPTSNLQSNAQSQKSFPSGPSRDNPPRRSIAGGYVLDNATTVSWGSRIANRPLDPAVRNDSIGAIYYIKRKFRANRWEVSFIMFGPESYKQYMVMTQSMPFFGWVGMDPKLITQFEGETEAIARKLLEEEVMGSETMSH
ncbi:hypothetical protein BYT27DRAFT_7220496 [Phlegmacium glaucopus]|nr:hypothetical protein BYT27DRAFT_7220496 [Phlegmacium glaucopus]